MGEFAIGNVLLGRYRIDELLGTGGQAIVYDAFDLENDRQIALKVISSEQQVTEIGRQRFLNEFSVLSQLHHPSIVKAFDSHETESGTLFFTMEKVTGQNLSTILKNAQGPVFETKELLLLLKEITGAVQAVHDKGLVYRDLKPGNIILCDGRTAEDEHRVKLIDFGLAVPSGNAEELHQVMPGTVWYMSPEQVRGIRIDSRSDIYSFGMLAYELITGKVPLPDLPINSVMTFHMLGKVPKPVPLNKDLPSRVTTMSLICLEKKAKDRYPTMKELGKALENTLQKHQKRKNGGIFHFWYNLFGKKQGDAEAKHHT